MEWSNWITKQVYLRSKFVQLSKLNSKFSDYFNKRCELCLEVQSNKKQNKQNPNKNSFLCSVCLESLPTFTSCCPVCSIPLPKTGYCGQCLKKKPAFDSAHCNFIYSTPIDGWLYRLKHKHQTPWAHKLASLMLHNPPDNLANIDAFTFVPSSLWHRVKRGFNPAELIARDLAKELHKPILNNLVIRSHSTEQKELGRQARINNVKKHFHQTQKRLQGQHIMIIDDVMTTGSTAHTLALLLKKTGAKHVSIWCLARTPKP
jgi:ComF family protein